MSDNGHYTSNEEFDFSVALGSRPASEYIIFDSDSEDGSNRINYFDFSSSSSDSDDEKGDYFRRFKEPEVFLECSRNDDDDDLIIPLETEDCDFTNVDLDPYGQMSCPICEIVFKSKLRFVIHRRRHFALDHFICPVCQMGFTKLEQCQAHEYKEHKEAQEEEEDPVHPRYYFRSRNARKSTTCDGFHVDEEDLISIAPSTTLYPYDGPAVNDIFQCYQIELKYGKSERKSHSRIQSKYAVERRKYYNIFLEHKLAQIHAKEEKRKRKKRERAKLLRNETDLVKGSDEENVAPVSRSAVAHLTALPPRKPQDQVGDRHGHQCYFCSLCGFTAENKEGIEDHQDQFHPNVPVSELLQFLFIDKSSKHPKARQARKRTRQREKLTPAQIARAKKLQKKEKLKAARLFRKRRHVPRLWEKPGSPTQDEFAFAIGLKRKSDVFLGARGAHHSSITSGLLRSSNCRSNPFDKQAVITLTRLPPMESSRVYCCQHCAFFAPSMSDIRAHRRAEHFKSLRQTKEKDETQTVVDKVPAAAPESSLASRRQERLNRRRTHAESAASAALKNPFRGSAELQVHLDDISVNIEAIAKAYERGDANSGTTGVPPPARKKFRVK